MPFAATLPLPLPFGSSSFFVGFLGCAVKKPSSLPCCLALTPLVNFSAPFRTRSSLRAVSSRNHNRQCSLLETLVLDKKIDEAVDVRALPFHLQTNSCQHRGRETASRASPSPRPRPQGSHPASGRSSLPPPTASTRARQFPLSSSSPLPRLPLSRQPYKVVKVHLGLGRRLSEGSTYLSLRCSTTSPSPPCSRISFNADLGPTPRMGSR